MRDPSHVRSYRLEERVSFLTEAGLTLRYISGAWKEHRFPELVARTGRSETIRRELEEMILSSVTHAKELFSVKVENDRVVSYSDDKGIVAGRKAQRWEAASASTGRRGITELVQPA